MNISIKDSNTPEIELMISVDWDQVQNHYSDLLKKYAKLPVKGFRPGSAPQTAIEKIFHKEIRNDMIYLCSQQLCGKALTDSAIRAGSPISVSDAEMVPYKRFCFKANFLRMPDFELPDYSNLNITSEKQEEKLTEVSEKLLAHTQLDVHDDFIERELVFSDTEEGIAEDSSRENAKNRVKLLLILKRIAEVDHIEIDEQDVDARVEEIAKENDIPVRELKDYLIKTGGLSRLRDFLLAEYVMDYIIEINS
ncbi:MAG: hypothetical protein LBP67_05660 [Bacteroidales bacterium]|jgi:FKBP-type peptidyl-prolyl cis-trans isomerase (trigger factor)|nr:hypothetical protein [Bacteroidales bacterium]